MTSFHASDYLKTLEPYLPEELVSRPNLGNMQAVACLLPGALVSFFGFECRLGAGEMPSDILFCVGDWDMQRQVLAGLRPGIDLPESFWTQPVWSQARDFGAAWADPDSVLHDKVRNVWLEFDMHAPPPAVPLPSIFFGSHHIRSDCEYEWITRTALPRLTGRSVPEPIERKLIDCIRHLPAEVGIFQMGAMVAREPMFVRICIGGPDPDQIISYLNNVGWPGQTGELESLVVDLASLVDRIDLDLDVSDRVGPKVGLECSFVPKKPPKYEPRWFDFLNYMVEKGLCTPGKREALLRYSGHAHEQSDPERWPQSLLAASRLMGSRFFSVITRGLHHVKIVYQPDRSPEAKAYLWADHFWLSPQELRRAAKELSQPRRLEEL